jgi:hypothetical protein
VTTFNLKISPTSGGVFAVGALYAHRLQFVPKEQSDGCNTARSNLSRQLVVQCEESYAELRQHHLPAPLL